MKEVHIDFEEYNDEVVKIKGFQKIDCHMIFDVIMGDNIQRKARLVSGGTTTEAPSSITCYSVVYLESVKNVLAMAALNGLNVSSCDI